MKKTSITVRINQAGNKKSLTIKASNGKNTVKSTTPVK